MGHLNVSSEHAKCLHQVDGTPPYMSPEQCMGYACKASDVWAVGILTYQLLTGTIPYGKGITALGFVHALGRDASIAPVLDLSIPPSARSFCEAILKRDPTLRPTADELLHHPFLLS